MRKTSYQTLLNTRSKYDSMLTSLGVVQKNNRWDEAYRLVTKLEQVRVEGTIDELSGEELGRMRFALTDISNLSLILEQFDGDKSPIFESKFKEMLKGSKNQIEESNSSSRARDTQFELLMCARFREVGLRAFLGDIHPDISLEVNGHRYGFECKRIFNFNQGAVQSNIEKAISQLNNYFFDADSTRRGLPILCIDRYITGGDKVLMAHDEASVRKELGDQIEEFVKRHYKRWNGAKAKDGRLIGVLIFMNVTAILNVEGLPVVCHQFGASNSGWAGHFKLMFDDFVNEIASLLGPMDRSRL
ncbi:MAG: hypothetical protein ABIR46_04065 [Candidatus Saccharimonadales bacterium]